MKMIREFNVSCYGVELPFKFFSIDYIWKELNRNKELYGRVIKMENVSKAIIKKYYNEHSEELGKNSRHFAYIKFCNYNGECYGIVGGKTNYTNPDLSFDGTNNQSQKDNRYARNFLDNNKMKWDKTIIIINHKPSNSEEADKKEAFFIECYLQRIFNLFES